ncbi:MAG TPA: hypothetical protein H9834_03415 [Candidatus Barnesiella excrementavium]|nr:hypothetical protein [Candidatus Barnesiella excrementavium]
MKKYIIGLFSAICLMGAGCTEFEDFEAVDMGEGPSVKVEIEKTAVDAFDLKITPGEGASHYAYLITNEALSLDADNLLQAKYENAKLLSVTETPSVAESMTNQKIGTTYYVYAVAADSRGLCGAIASASLVLPDEEAPYITDNRLEYTATNKGRTIKITFNEIVLRGEGSIEYSLNTVSGTGAFEPYKSGVLTSENVVISDEVVTVTLPDDAVFNETEGVVTYVFISLSEGAFQDASGNKSRAMKGVDVDGAPMCPWWQYAPGASTTTGITIEIDESVGYGKYAFIGTSMNTQFPDYADALRVYPGETAGALMQTTFDHDYGFMGFGSYFCDEDSKFDIYAGDISDDGLTLNLECGLGSDGYIYASCDIPAQDGSRYYFAFVAGVYDEVTNKVSVSKEITIPFVADETEPLRLNTENAILCYAWSPADEEALELVNVLLDPYIIPVRLVQTASVARSFEPSINREIKANAIKAQVNSMKNLQIKSDFLRK